MTDEKKVHIEDLALPMASFNLAFLAILRITGTEVLPSTHVLLFADSVILFLIGIALTGRGMDSRSRIGTIALVAVMIAMLFVH